METLISESLDQEYRRIKKLSEFDLDFCELQDHFKSLIKVSELIAGTDVSVVNLLDNYTQWSLSSCETNPGQIPREDSICSHTITSNKIVEVQRLDLDERFKNKPSVVSDDGFKYYLGMPLTLSSGENVGVLCMMHREEMNMSEEKKAALRVIANEIVNKLELRRKLNETLFILADTVRMKNQVAHDVRGPVHGISGLAESVEGEDLSKEQMKEYFMMIKDSGKGILDLTDEILTSGRDQHIFRSREFSLGDLKNRLFQLYELPAKAKKINFKIDINPEKEKFSFSRKKLLSIFGNLISNAIKFTPENGNIKVDLDIINSRTGKQLHVYIKDSGVGLSTSSFENNPEVISESSKGTSGEKGFGLGLKLVKEMVKDLDGKINISSEENLGTEIEVFIPVK